VKPTGFIITKPDGTQTVYKNLCLVALKMECLPLRVKEWKGKPQFGFFKQGHPSREIFRAVNVTIGANGF